MRKVRKNAVVSSHCVPARVYQRFLEKVVETTEYFHDVAALQSKWRDLTATRDEVDSDMTLFSKQLEETRIQLKQFETVRNALCPVWWTLMNVLAGKANGNSPKE